jgi:signal transduction histidine kinase/CheY-like chemotaxis protein
LLQVNQSPFLPKADVLGTASYMSPEQVGGERFHRVEGSRGRTHEGTGIGLALVQELVKLHRVDPCGSLPGEGTAFVVSVPFGTHHLPSDHVREDRAQVPVDLAANVYAEEAWHWLSGGASAGDSLPAEAYAESAADDRPFILVADDNTDMRNCFRSLLSDRYSVETVADGEAALAVIQRRRPDLVLADVMMPRLDGFGLLRTLRANPETRAIPVIMVSARAGEDERIEGMEHGADDYLVKPFRFRELRARVQAHLELARIRRETAERDRKLRAEADSQRALLEAVLKEMPAGLVIAKAPSGEVMLANHQAKEILQRSIGELRSVGEYAGYQLFRLSGQPYGLEEQPLARSVLHGEVVIGEELKYLRPDGTFRVLLANSAPVRNETGAIVASVVAFHFQDITDLRVAQEELLRERNDVIHDLAGRLITAQEEERKRIARELHDDICQKLAMLSIELEQTNGDSEGLPTVTKKRLEELRQHCSRIGSDVQALSHELHSSKLEYFGVVSAVRDLCRELAKQHGANIEFKDENVPKPLPRDISLCLFRVAQEALHNALKYSGVKRFAVELGGAGEGVQLVVRDAGAGFDLEEARLNGGLGLLSMQERLKLVHGRLDVESRPGEGTRIVAVVPVLAENGESAATGQYRARGAAVGEV